MKIINEIGRIRQYLSILILLPVILQAQVNKGIQFETGLNWKQVLEKAKLERKNIFIDCFATWCEPCKYMEKNVFPNDTVGSYMNEQFISVKIQFDSTKEDNEEARKWYSDANSLREKYKITAYPAYLFFTSEGKILHKDVGAKSIDDFISAVANSLKPEKQYYILLDDYQRGIKNYKGLPYLANTAERLGEKDLAYSVACDYIGNYLFSLEEGEFYSKKNIEFMDVYIENSGDMSFDIFYKHSERVNSIMGKKEYAQGIVDRIITKEEIDPIKQLNENAEDLNWKKMYINIKLKYGKSYADRNILKAKESWYFKKEKWAEFINYAIKDIETYGVDTTSFWGDAILNDTAWYIFLHSKNRNQIKQAIKWMQSVTVRNPKSSGNLDTYANLLYKLGNNKEAIQVEEAAEGLSPDAKDIQDVLTKMRKGEPTWIGSN